VSDIQVDASQVEELRKKLARWAKVAPEEVKLALMRAGRLVENEAKDKHFRGYKMPRGEGHPTNAWLKVRTDRLRSSIATEVKAFSSGQFSARVGTTVGYGRKHELGLEGMPERPFLRPSLEKKRPEVFEEIRKAFMKAYGK